MISKRLNAFSSLIKTETYFLFFLYIVISLYLGRFLIMYDLPLNPDEALFTANALRSTYFGWNWNALDSGSSGPLNSVILAWPSLFGLDITLATTRITSLLLSASTAFFLYLSLKLVFSRIIAFSFSTIFLFFYATTFFNDFAHYSSEKFPTFLISIALYLLIKLTYELRKKQPSLIEISVLSMIIGVLPYIKLQSILFAVLFGIWSLFWFFTITLNQSEKLKILVRGSVVLLLPSIVIVLHLMIHGGIGEVHDAYYSYIGWAIEYVVLPLNLEKFLLLTKQNPEYNFLFLFMIKISFVSLFLYSVVKKENILADTITLLFSVAMLYVGYQTVVSSGKAFPHYLNFTTLPLVFSAGFLISLFFKQTYHYITLSPFRKVLFVIPLFLMIYVCYSISPTYVKHVDDIKNDHFRNMNPNILDKNNFLSYLHPKTGDTLLVWGWMAQYYYESGLPPATKEASTYNQITHSAYLNYFRSRLMGELLETKPEYVIDVVSPGAFGFNNPQQQGIGSFRELNKFIGTQYKMITPAKRVKECPRVYISNERYPEFSNKQITPSSITVSASYDNDMAAAEHLNDNLVFESCYDYWLLPDGVLGSVDFSFDGIQKINEISILNTNNKIYGDRKTKKINLTLFNKGQIVYQQKIKLKNFPRWNNLVLENRIEADTARIDIVKYDGLGGGLNEVKFFK